MTKIEETRIQPGGIEAIDQLRKIAHRHEAGTVNEVLIDAPSAAVTVQLNNNNETFVGIFYC